MAPDLLKKIWSLALKEQSGLGVSNSNPAWLKANLLAFRQEHPEWEELKQFYIVEVHGEVQIRRARNTPPSRVDGDYRPLED